MAERILVGTDIHLFGPHQLMDPYDKSTIFKLKQLYALTGDNIDNANCKRDQLSYAAEITKELMDHFGDLFVFGNHIMIPNQNEFCIRTINQKKVLFSHLHIPLWGREKTEAYMGKSMGAGFFKRSLSWTFNKFRDSFGGFKIKESDIKKIVDYAKLHKCQVIIGGHIHPKETYDKKHSGVRVIILKRGINEIWI